MLFRKAILSALLLVLTASVASAYTLVMRDGRRVQIPDTFNVTGSTLTYEVSSGFQITVQLSGVNIAATERANGEPQGSFLQRASAAKVVAQSATAQPRAGRSITNKDLEVYRRTRLASEVAYEKRRKELGLPTVEQQRLEVAAVEQRTYDQLLNRRDNDQRAEDYWRDRATAMRTEMASNQAQIEYVRQRLSELPQDNYAGGFSSISPYGTFGAPVIGFPYQNTVTSNVFGSSLVMGGARVSSGFGFPIARQPLYGAGYPINRNYPGRYRRYRNGQFDPWGQNLFALPYQSYDYSQERMELTSQLNELQMQQAGFNARWKAMEEEARRAGVYPGWLRR